MGSFKLNQISFIRCSNNFTVALQYWFDVSTVVMFNVSCVVPHFVPASLFIMFSFYVGGSLTFNSFFSDSSLSHHTLIHFWAKNLSICGAYFTSHTIQHDFTYQYAFPLCLRHLAKVLLFFFNYSFIFWTNFITMIQILVSPEQEEKLTTLAKRILQINMKIL